MIEKHVTTLETSKRLKELGVKQESEFYWSIPKEECISDNPIDVANHRDCEPMLVKEKGMWGDGFYDVSAYLSSELGELLDNPKHRITNDKVSIQFSSYYTGSQKTHTCEIKYDSHIDNMFQDKNMFLLQQQVLIYLLENNLTTL